MSKRYRILSLLLLVALQTSGQQDQKEKKIVLFVCEHGAARSLIASAYFNKLAAEKGLNYTSIFRGAAPDSTLSLPSVEGLKSDGLYVPNQKPMPVSEDDEKQASHIVTFDCTVPVESEKLKANWSNIPSVKQNYEKARDEILAHVLELIAQLEKEK